MSLFLGAVEFGSYISPIKLAIFVVLSFALLPALAWVYKDARNVRTKEAFWTAAVFGAGALGIMLMLLLPMFIVGAAAYVVITLAALTAYVKHRDIKVPHDEKILSADGIKALFENKEKKKAAVKGTIVYITANKNEVPVPEPRTIEAAGYKAANELFEDSIWRRANEIILFPTAQSYTVNYRIDGVAVKQPDKDKQAIDSLNHFLKQLADLDPNEKRKPQSGKFTVRKGNDLIQWQVTTSGSTVGEQVKLLLIESQNVRRLDEIGFNPDQLEPLKSYKDVAGKVFIVSGPRKSGVSTTFYAMLKNHDPFLNSIVTLEKQPAAEIPNIAQTKFTLSDTGTTTYSKRLQTLMRTGPDIIGVADVEDQQTAVLACQAAAKNNMHVYVIIEAESALAALSKWMKLVNDQNLVADTLGGLSNQRLIRKLCPECKQAYEPNKELLKKFNIPADKVKTLYRAGEPQLDKRGRPIPCPKCQSTGFYGRIATFETIVANDEVRNAVRSAKSIQEIATSFRRARMLFLQEQALRKVVDGTTAINELIREFTPAQKPAPAAAPAPAAKS